MSLRFWIPIGLVFLGVSLFTHARDAEEGFGNVDNSSNNKYPGCAHVPLPRIPARLPELRWLKLQVRFWYGDLYPLVASNPPRWHEVLVRISHSPYAMYVGGMLTIDDTTEEKVRAKYKDYGAYRHWHNAYVLCDILQHAPATKQFTAAHRFPVLMVDSIGQWEPVIASRRSTNPGSEFAVLWPWPYHLELSLKGLRDYRNFLGKINKVVFRGALSGPVRHTEMFHAGMTKTSRLGLVHAWANATWADMGISLVPEHQKTVVESDPEIEAQVRAAMKPTMSVTDLMQYRYVLCIEGADISSGFGWVLASNSVPFHPYPFLYHVWYFNGLQPWIHFVPILADGSDLYTAYQWCESHQEECNKIAEAGREHMTSMLNKDYITAIKQEVVLLWNLQDLFPS